LVTALVVSYAKPFITSKIGELKKKEWPRFTDLGWTSLHRCKRRLKSAAGVTWVTGRFKSAASSLTMKHVSQYGRLERDTETGVGRRSEPAADSAGDEVALADVEEDSGTQ